MSATMHEAPTRAPEVRLIDELRGGIDDLKRLAALELDLAKSEAGVAIKRLAVAAGLAVGALLFLYAAFIFGITLVAYVLGAYDHWWGLGITVLVLLVITALLAVLAMRIVKKARIEAASTIKSIKGDVEWLRQLATQRPSSS